MDRGGVGVVSSILRGPLRIPEADGAVCGAAHPTRKLTCDFLADHDGRIHAAIVGYLEEWDQYEWVEWEMAL